MKITVPISKITGDIDAFLTNAMKYTNIEPFYNEENQTSTYDVGAVKYGMFTFQQFYLLMTDPDVQITEIEFWAEVDKSKLDLTCLENWPYSFRLVAEEFSSIYKQEFRKISEYFQVEKENDTKAVLRLIPLRKDSLSVNTPDRPDKELFAQFLGYLDITNILTKKEKTDLLRTKEYAGENLL